MITRSGALKAAALSAIVGVALAHAAVMETVELSAPIFPKVLVMYAGEGSNYPTTQAGREDLADRSALTYPQLLTECADAGYAIVLSADGGSLTTAQLARNYDEVASCSYQVHTAKPYWIPQLAIDVDICGRQLGAGWRLLAESDLRSFRASDFAYLQDVIDAGAAAGNGMGTFYFSTSVYVRADDGGMLQGDLSPTAAMRTAPLPATVCAATGGCPAGDELKYHLEAGLALRCIKRN